MAANDRRTDGEPAEPPDSNGSITIDVIAGSFLPTFSRGFRTSHRIRPRYFAYLSAHALTPPASFMNVFNCVGGTLQRATYRNARAHLLIALLSALSSLVQRIAAVNGSAFLSKGSSANLNACRKSVLVFKPYFVMLHDCKHGF